MTELRIAVIAVDGYRGSGSDDVARALAERLGLPCYGTDEQLGEAARISGIALRLLKKYAERNMYAAYDLAAEDYDKIKLPPALALIRAKNSAVLSLARLGPCVFAGGHASAALSGVRGAVRIFVRADIGSRANAEGCAARDVERADKKRRAYYRQIDRAWGTPAFYSLEADASGIGAADVSERIAEYFSREENPF
jgi:cytidylate kinase